MKVRAEIEGQDWIEGEKLPSGAWRLKARGCSHFLALVRDLSSRSPDPEAWTPPQGASHSELLLKEFILKVKGKWQYPYPHEELCHCRAVPTLVVDRAIMNGAQTTAKVSRETSASTSCTTCRPDVECIIKYRLGS